MRNVCIVTHGQMGIELLGVARDFFGAGDSFQAIAFEDSMSLIDLQRKIEDCVDISNNEEILFLVDIPSGSPYNVLQLLKMVNSNIEVIAGVNLPIVLQLIATPDIEASNLIVEGREAIRE